MLVIWIPGSLLYLAALLLPKPLSTTELISIGLARKAWLKMALQLQVFLFWIPSSVFHHFFLFFVFENFDPSLSYIDSTVPFGPLFLAQRTTSTTTILVSKELKPVRLTPLVRDIRNRTSPLAWNFWHAGTDGIIEKIRRTVGDKPVYLSIDVNDIYSVPRILSDPDLFRRLIPLTPRSHLPLEHPRPVAGPRASCALSWGAWMAWK